MLGVKVTPSQPRGTLREPAEAAAGTSRAARRAASSARRRMREGRTAGQSGTCGGRRRALLSLVVDITCLIERWTDAILAAHRNSPDRRRVSTLVLQRIPLLRALLLALTA